MYILGIFIICMMCVHIKRRIKCVHLCSMYIENYRTKHLSSSEASTVKGSPPRGEDDAHKPFVPYWRDNPHSWDENSNDADLCCIHENVSDTYIIWGASTQGRSPKPPLTGTDAGTNVVGMARGVPLQHFLPLYFNQTTKKTVNY
eukprot:m.104457 g.104457  ORF g.104457 m.104457 type:complete len:145 (-) comp13843_c0_seq2:18-452(-)